MNRMEHLEDNGFQHTSKSTKCSICKTEGHNKHTCKKVALYLHIDVNIFINKCICINI